MKQFVILAKDAGPNESAWDVLKRGSEDKPKLSLTVPIDSSKRAEKRVGASYAIIDLCIADLLKESSSTSKEGEAAASKSEG